jgi:hypothetical protein
MIKYTIGLDAQCVLEKAYDKKPQFHAGKARVTRKKLPVIDVASEPSMVLSCWYIMWMAT